jgi:hypothetical protein
VTEPRLRLAPELVLPAEAITETFGLLATRGAGKRSAAAVMAEEMFAAKLPLVGRRAGRRPGGPDLRRPPRRRAARARPAASSSPTWSWTSGSRARRRTITSGRSRWDEPFLLRAWENIVRRGRARGLGCTLITQRSAVLNKNVLTQVQTLIPMRTTGPQDIAAIREWVKYHHQGEALLATLPALEDGEAWVWSPHFLKKMVRVRFRRRATFDSGATPKASASPRPPATLADVDLGQLKTKMAAIEVPVLTDAQVKRLPPRQSASALAERLWMSASCCTDLRAEEASGRTLVDPSTDASDCVSSVLAWRVLEGSLSPRPDARVARVHASHARVLLRATHVHSVTPTAGAHHAVPSSPEGAQGSNGRERGEEAAEHTQARRSPTDHSSSGRRTIHDSRRPNTDGRRKRRSLEREEHSKQELLG